MITTVSSLRTVTSWSSAPGPSNNPEDFQQEPTADPHELHASMQLRHHALFVHEPPYDDTCSAPRKLRPPPRNTVPNPAHEGPDALPLAQPTAAAQHEPQPAITPPLVHVPLLERCPTPQKLRPPGSANPARWEVTSAV